MCGRGCDHIPTKLIIFRLLEEVNEVIGERHKVSVEDLTYTEQINYKEIIKSFISFRVTFVPSP